MQLTDRRTDTGVLEEVVDLDRYPLDRPTGEWEAAVGKARRELAASGCAVLTGFVRAGARAVLRAECAAAADRAYDGAASVNVYNTAPDDSLPAGHPARHRVERGNSFVARDDIPASSVIHRLYTSPAFQGFVAACLGLDRIHPLADPLAGLCLNVVRPGRGHPWHFDTNEFAISLLTQEPDAGGAFEYCPGIRSAEDEHFDDVAAVLEGRGEHLINRIELRPGDLQLFHGRYSLHRVTTVAGSTDRHTAIFSYSEQPDVVGSPERTRQLFGRLTAQHDRESARVDGLLD